MATALNAAVVGCGIAGAAAAIQLHRLGHAVEMFERCDTDISTGAGLLLQPPALVLLEQLGIGADLRQHGAPVRRVRAQTLRGRSLMNLELAQQPAQDVALGVQRVALLKLLKAAIPAHVRLRHSHAMTAVDCEHGFLFSDHGIRHGPFDLIVVADGANSALRRSLPSLVRRDRIYGSAAVVCCIDDRERIHTDCLNQYFDRTRHLSTWPVGPLVIGAPAGINLSMNIPLEQAGDLLACGGWKARVIAHSPQLACLMHGAAETARPAIYRYRDVELARSNLGRVVFIGDAAHSMSPQLGAGVWLALLDASVLAQTLREVDRPLAALSAFDRRQRSRVTRYQRLSRWLTPMFQSESPTRAVVRDTVIFGLMRMPVIARWVRSLLASE